MPNTQLGNPAGNWGATSTPIGGNGTIAEFVVAASVTANTLVGLSTTEGQVVPLATNATQGTFVGVALSTVGTGGVVMVQVGGPIFGLAKSTAAADNFSQFDLITFSSTTTASAAKLANTTAVTQFKDLAKVIGVAMAAATTGATTVDALLLVL